MLTLKTMLLTLWNIILILLEHGTNLVTMILTFGA
jgi:hypothetical protein